MSQGSPSREWFQLIWPALLVWQVLQRTFVRWKAARRQKEATAWPVVPGTVRGGSVRPVAGAYRLTLSYNFVERGYGNDLWWHDFANQQYAEHAKRVLTDSPIAVHYNPAREQDTELLWSELQAILARQPFVPQLLPLSRTGYNWTLAFAAVSVTGLAANIALYVMAMFGTTACLCEAMLWLTGLAVVLLVVAIAPLTRMSAMSPVPGVARSTWWVFAPWQRLVMGSAVLFAVASFSHFAPIAHALKMSEEIPDAVFAGTIGVLAIPVDLFCAIVALETLRRRHPMPELDPARTPA